MKLLIAAIPLFDADMTAQAYYLQHRNSTSVLDMSRGHTRMHDALISPGLQLVSKVGVEPFAGDVPLFADINRYQLLTGMPTNLRVPPEQMVVVLPADIPADEEVTQRLEALRRLGYRLAFDDLPAGGSHPLMHMVEYIVLDYKQRNRFAEKYAAVRLIQGMRAVIRNIGTTEQFEALAGDRTALFTGQFYNQPITKNAAPLTAVKVNALQLLNEVNSPDFELEDITAIIQRDPYLSISLLRFINSGALNLGRQIESIQTAVATLGQEEVRRWANVAISVSLAEDRPGEIIKLSLVRAKFAENLAGAFELGVFQQGLFMTGLFSLLDVILQKPMVEAFKEVSVAPRVREALVENKGDFAPVMELIYAYEKADWDTVTILMIRAGIEPEALGSAFIDALLWYRQLLQTVERVGEENTEAAQ